MVRLTLAAAYCERGGTVANVTRALGVPLFRKGSGRWEMPARPSNTDAVKRALF